MDVLARTGALDYARECAVRESEVGGRVRGRPAAFAAQGKPARISVLRGPAHVLKQRAQPALPRPAKIPFSRRGAAQLIVPATANRGVA